ncbi:hypothetical protein [Flavobacterium columnare]|uniref:hypothetical protein n=1 Tax=Flavobacterium columnare TaxID=996 RepID=UPI000D1B1CEF|nr:hypothetical protein [Flavobacterium columnare]PTD14375.1 hypothetical protein C6N29_07960 [Flavobacterium columnare]
MNIKQITALINDFSNDVLKDFNTTQEEFKGVAVQEAFKLLERRKMDVKLAQKKDFWDRFTHNIELLTLRFRDVLKDRQSNPTKQERINQFFKYYDKEINS